MALYIGNQKVTGIQSIAGGTVEWGDIEGTLSNQTDLQNALESKQATLISGTNIKTINNNSILGEGNLVIEGGESTVDQVYNGTSAHAQSGVAISGAKFLNNKATGTNSLSILGSTSSNTASTNVGVGSSADNNGSSFGYMSSSIGEYSLAIGSNAETNANRAYQIGTGTNSTANSLFCGFGTQTNYKMLDGATGLIPQERVLIPINTLDTSGSISLSDNSVNVITPSGAVTFVLPLVTDNTVFHQILVQLYMSTVYSITLGTSYYFNSTAPDMSSVGVYSIVYEYNAIDQYWAVGAIKIGTFS